MRADGGEPAIICMIRGTFRRQNLVLRVHQLNSGSMRILIAHVGALLDYNLKNCSASSKERHIVTCLTRGNTEPLHRKLCTFFASQNVCVENCLYHGGLTENEREDAIIRWNNQSKKHFIMFCTEFFSARVDAPNVRTVIIVGRSRSLVEFWQVASRGGRDGNRAVVHVVYYQSHIISAAAYDREEVLCTFRPNDHL